MSVAVEQRRYTRFEIELQAQLECADGRLHDCLIRDYCSGGMLVQQHQAGRDRIALRIGQTVTLRTALLTGTGTTRVGIGATVAWSRDDHFGVTFHQASEEIVEALRRHDRIARAGDHRGDGHGRAQGGEARCLARFRHVAQGVLPGLLRELLVKAQQDLVETADRVQSNTEQQQVFGDMNALDDLRNGDVLLRAILERALERADADPPLTPPQPGELSLVDPDDFERWLEASRVATSLERRFGSQLSAIGSRLGGLRCASTPGSLAVPFEPQHFTAALKDVAKRLDLGAITRNVLFDSASHILTERLGGFYADLDAALDAMGAPAAQLKPGVAVRPSPAPQQAPQQPTTASPEPGEAPASPMPHPTAGEAVPAATYATPAGPPGHYVPLASIDPVLLENLLAREREQRETLAHELMTMVADTPDMTDSMASWLQQLNKPLVQEAVADQQFFQNKQHPLREIVDALGHLQMFRANPDPDPADDPLRQQVSTLLESISAGDADAQLLRSVADAVAELTDEQSRRYQRNVERLAEANEGRDRVRHARMAVVDAINSRYAGRQVPEVIPELLDVGWRAVLELAWLNSTDGEGHFADRLALLDNLVAALGGEAFAPNAPRPSCCNASRPNWPRRPSTPFGAMRSSAACAANSADRSPSRWNCSRCRPWIKGPTSLVRRRPKALPSRPGRGPWRSAPRSGSATACASSMHRPASRSCA